MKKPLTNVCCFVLLVAIIANIKSFSQCSTFPNSVGTSNSSNLPGSWFSSNSTISNMNINIIGTLTLNTDLTLINVNLDFAPSSKIVIQSGYTLTIKTQGNGDSHLQSCGGNGDMWEGIELQGLGIPIEQLKIYGSASHPVIIEDAVHAVYSTTHASFFIDFDYAIFNRNYMDIDLIGPVGYNSATPTMSSITNCKFLCRQFYNSTSNSNALHTPYNGLRTSVAINLWFTSIYLGTNAANRNIIDNADYGVKTKRSVFRSYFTTIKNNFWNVHAFFDGFLTLEGNTLTDADVAIECNTDIWAEILHNTISNNTFGCKFSIGNPHIIIDGNTFQSSAQYAVYNYNCFYTNSISPYWQYIIANNIISPASTSVNANGFFWSETLPINPNPADAPTFKIYNNSFDNANGTSVNKAIDLLNIYAPQVYDNTNINIGGSTGFGIHIVNCVSAKVKNNTVNGDGNNYCSNGSKGIWNDGCNGAEINCNYVNLVERGFQFENVTLGDLFLRNTMADCHYQFYLLNNPGTGKIRLGRGAANNLWLESNCSQAKNTYSDNSNYLMGINNAWRKTNFYADNCINCIPLVNDHSPTGVNCVRTNPLWPYNAFTCINNGEINDNRLANLQDLADSSVWNPDADPAQWIANEYLLQELEANDSLVNGDSLLEAVRNYLESTNIHTLHDLLNSIGSLYIEPVDSDSLQAANNNIYVGDMPTYYYKTINEILINAVENGYDRLNEDQLATIHEIAALCPLEAGSAVYIARAMLVAYGEEPQDYEDACKDYSSPSARKAHNQSLEPPKTVFANLYPNPVHDLLNINYNLGDNIAGIIQFINTDGRLEFENILTESRAEKELKINSLRPGVYQVVIKSGQTIIAQKRVVIF